MRSAALQNEKAHIDDLFREVQSFSGDPYYKSLLTYYLCIRVSGFLENCVRIVFTEYSTPNSQGQVRIFVTRKLEKFPNPTWSEIINLAKAFSDQWAKDLKAKVSKEQLIALKSINLNRNAIAHGGTSGITLSELSNYYTNIVSIIENLEDTCV